MGNTSQHPAQLVAIGYPETFVASLAMEQLESLRGELQLRPDEAAAIVRDDAGSYRVETNDEIAPEGSSGAIRWRVLFASLFSLPMLEMSLGDVRAILRQVDRAGLDEEFVRRVREMVRPGTSALFVLVSRVSPDEIVLGLEAYGGTVLQSDVPSEIERVFATTPDADDEGAVTADGG